MEGYTVCPLLTRGYLVRPLADQFGLLLFPNNILEVLGDEMTCCG